MPQTRATGRNAQGLLRAGERRRPPRLEAARAVLRGLAGLPRGARSRAPARSTPPRRASGTAPASGAAPTSARPGSSRARASPTARTASCKLSKVSGLTAGARAPARRRRGLRRVREPRRRRHLVAAQHARRPAGPRRLERSRATSRPAISACRRSCRTRTTPSRFWAVVQGFGIFETTDDGASWTPRNRGLRADWPLEDPEVGFCVHKLVMSPVDNDRLYQQNHVGMHRSDDAGQSWTEITEGLPTEFGFAAAAHPHDRDSFYVIPLDPGHGRCMPEGTRGRLAHAATPARRWRRLDRGLPQDDAHLGVLREGHGDRHATTCPASTSARARARCSRAPTRARAGARSRATCPRSPRSRSRWSRRRWPTSTSRRRCRRSSATCRAALEVDAATVGRGDRAARRALARPARPAVRARARRCGRTSTSTSTASAPGSTRRSTRARAST